jgi:Guanylate-binding protein, N-terminal domain
LDLYDEKLRRQITSKEYLESSLLLDSDKSKLAVRQSIREFFKERDCFTLPRPVTDEKLLRNIEKVGYEELREPFKQQVELLISSVRNNLKPKVVDNVPVDGTAYCKLIEHLVFSINNQSLPKISETWDRIV